MDMLFSCLVSQQLSSGGLAGPIGAALSFRLSTGLGSGVQCLGGQNQAKASLCVCVWF